jgi:hypothetical protein
LNLFDLWPTDSNHIYDMRSGRHMCYRLQMLKNGLIKHKFLFVLLGPW